MAPDAVLRDERPDRLHELLLERRLCAKDSGDEGADKQDESGSHAGLYFPTPWKDNETRLR
jgi:hypothetical protein